MIYDIVGIIGVILILAAFFLLQIGKLNARDFLYSLLNLFGALGILISLIQAWNLSAFLIEMAWTLISIYGLIKHSIWKKRAG
jgi:paired small multidrug resistance pump